MEPGTVIALGALAFNLLAIIVGGVWCVARIRGSLAYAAATMARLEAWLIRVDDQNRMQGERLSKIEGKLSETGQRIQGKTKAT